MKKRNILSWSWILFVLFMGLSLVDIRFGLLGFICMMSPVLFALAGKKKKHCSSLCPRASLLKNLLGRVSLKNTLPRPLRSDKFRWALFAFMMGMFAFSLSRSGGELDKIAFAMFRMIAVSSVISVLMGFFYKERSWCTVCPMGFSAKLIGNGIVPSRGKKRGSEGENRKKAS